MRNEKVWYLIAAILFFLLTVGYAVVIATDFYYGYTPEYLVVLHIMAAITFLAAAIVNFKRYRKRE